MYLYEYQFECSEQLASRVIGILSLMDVLQAFNVPGLPDADSLQRRINSDLRELVKRQTGSGA